MGGVGAADGFGGYTFVAKYIKYFTLCKALLCFFGTKMQLQENIYNLIIGGAPGIDGFQQVQGVYRLDQLYIRKHQFEFVRLEVTYEMPLDIGRHLRGLGGQLLRAVLSKDTLTGVVGLHEPFHRVEFGYSDKRHPFGQRCAYLMEILLNH